MKTVLAIDPGREKCGIALITPTKVLHMEVVSRADILHAAASLASAHSADEIIIGNGTGGMHLAAELGRAVLVPIHVVDEAYSSQRARTRFFDHNPPRGLRRLVPRGMLTPDRPYDDYVALILAEDYLARDAS